MLIRTTAEAVLRSCGETTCRVAVDPATVTVTSAPWWIRLWWRGPFVAITMPWGVYVRHEILQAPEQLGILIVHELAHVEQWRRLGFVRFLRRYLSEYVSLRRAGADHIGAYRGISLEVEARQAAGES